MIVFFIRRRARKLANQGRQRNTRTYVLLETRGDEMNPRDRELIQRRLIWYVGVSVSSTPYGSQLAILPFYFQGRGS
jgi:hypothetical protein